MEMKPFWIYDNFLDASYEARARIEDHFNEEIGRTLGLEKRTLWNYWHTSIYTYLRSRPQTIFPDVFPHIQRALENHMAETFGLVPNSNPVLSMYINGCGQGVHNDSGNGRLAYVYSFTRWEERMFEGGETLIYHLDNYSRITAPASGRAFYDVVEPIFNRLLVFDDRVPHAVRHVQGSMNPLNSRIVMHGHYVEPTYFPRFQGPLTNADLREQWHKITTEAAAILTRHNNHGFVTFEVSMTPDGHTDEVNAKYAQLLPKDRFQVTPIDVSIAEISEAIRGVRWPTGNGPSLTIFPVVSSPLQR